MMFTKKGITFLWTMTANWYSFLYWNTFPFLKSKNCIRCLSIHVVVKFIYKCQNEYIKKQWCIYLWDRNIISSHQRYPDFIYEQLKYQVRSISLELKIKVIVIYFEFVH